MRVDRLVAKIFATEFHINDLELTVHGFVFTESYFIKKLVCLQKIVTTHILL